MDITSEFLREEIAKMQQVVIAHNGAIEFAEHLLSRLEDSDHNPLAQQGISINDFAEMVAGNGAKVESIKAVE